MSIKRVRKHREHMADLGLKRVEVWVPNGTESALKEFAQALRKPRSPARTGSPQPRPRPAAE